MTDHAGIPWSWLHLLWLPIGGVLTWFMRRIERLEDGKVSRSEVAILIQRLDRMEDQQDQNHTDNTKRLDDILLALTGARNQR